MIHKWAIIYPTEQTIEVFPDARALFDRVSQLQGLGAKFGRSYNYLELSNERRHAIENELKTQTASPRLLHYSDTRK